MGSRVTGHLNSSSRSPLAYASTGPNMFIALVSGGGGGGFLANYEIREGEWRIVVTEDCNGLDFTL